MDIEKIKSYIMSLRGASHVAMFCFALASFNNIRSTILELDGTKFSAGFAGIALGGGLIIMAGMLAEMNPGRNRWYIMVISGTLAITTLSGAVQGYGYNAHIGQSGWFFGFAFPVAELLIALSVSAYKEHLDSKDLEEAQREFTRGVQRVLGQTINSIDERKIQTTVNKRALELADTIVQNTVDNVLSDMSASRQLTVDESRIDTPEKNGDDSQSPEVEPVKKPKKPPVKKLSTDARRVLIEQSISDDDIKTIADLMKLTGAARNTVKNDLSKIGYELNGNGFKQLTT
jgi:hypothetical protein